ncbi:MAG: FKBP-type peptidyl-prolyl cis-trans isomerase [Gammaproteobacteria bacterium]|nr:FKBP-type peptidyl-prolyl cis-trans isomerase [Gammaproteobacteria bacterium]
MSHQINQNSHVTLHYRISLEDGTELETSFGDEPLEFSMGEDTLTEGMELSILDLSAGDKQTITLSPDQTYGPRDPSNIHDILVADFPDDIKPEKGQVIAFDTPAGDDINGIVIDIKNDKVSVDFNHPLAGNHLVFEVEILKVNND